MPMQQERQQRLKPVRQRIDFRIKVRNDDFNDWSISIGSLKENGKNTIVFDALNRNTTKTIERKILENQ